jgi:uncharacterized protein YjgD (DUF1641 family)
MGESNSEVERADEVSREDREALSRAIAEHPDEVAAFVDRLGLVNDLLDTTALATGALDDDMVRRLAGTSSMLAESADSLATPETVRLAESVGESADDLDAALATLVRLQRSGTLDELADLVEAATLLTAALDDDMVRRLAATGASFGEVAEVAAEPQTARGIERLLRAVGEADAADPEPLGVRATVRALRDDEVRRGLARLVALLRVLGRESSEA